MGEWITVEYNKSYEGGAILLFRGFRCSRCGFERHKRHGTSKFCEECGAKMVQEEKAA